MYAPGISLEKYQFTNCTWTSEATLDMVISLPGDLLVQDSVLSMEVLCRIGAMQSFFWDGIPRSVSSKMRLARCSHAGGTLLLMQVSMMGEEVRTWDDGPGAVPWRNRKSRSYHEVPQLRSSFHGD